MEVKIAHLCNEFYQQSIPSKGKPSNNHEWTILAAIIQEDLRTTSLQLISMATGTKCIGHTLVSEDGSLLHDSHAEVLARRSFLIYLYEQIRKFYKKEDSIFVKSNTLLKVASHFQYHLFVNMAPCGDATIFPKDEQQIQNTKTEIIEKKRKLLEQDASSEQQTLKKIKIEDNQRTGAKPIKIEASNSQTKSSIDEEENQDAQQIGVVRIKPGRGPRTGALLSYFMEPVFLKTIFIGEKQWYNEQSVRRAFTERLYAMREQIQFPAVDTFCCEKESSIPLFKHRKTNETTLPCSFCCNFTYPNRHEVTIGHKGIKQGAPNKKELLKDVHYSDLCKKKLFGLFVEILKETNQWRNFLQIYFGGEEQKNTIDYVKAKESMKEYQQKMKLFYSQVPFKHWIKKTCNFCITIPI